MANWEALRLTDVIERIQKEELVLPVIQRNLVWNEEKIELLFDTLLKGDSFGGIMTIRDFRDKPPLFDYRKFILDFKDKTFLKSNEYDKLQQDISYVVDGQQRLQAFYIGLIGTYNNKNLFFDLQSDDDLAFRFALKKADLPEIVDSSIDGEKRKSFWYEVKSLFTEAKQCGFNRKNVIDFLRNRFGNQIDSKVEQNVESLIDELNNKNIGICEVYKSRFDKEDMIIRQEVIELFRRLNQGGTILSALDLAASKLKGYDSNVESFLNETTEFLDLGIGQDELLKLVFILQDNSKKSLTSIEQADAEFIVKYEKRIKNSLEGTRKFLEYSKLDRFFIKNQPSVIPLYFVAYHLFHKSETDDRLLTIFDNFETDNKDFKDIYKWIFLSLLNKTFRRKGAGWTTYTTGVKKILDEVKIAKDKEFPTSAIFKAYLHHPIEFSDEIKSELLDKYDSEFLLFIIYDMPKGFRKNDIDHIHPKSLLEKKFDWQLINSIRNYQLLNMDKNRGQKSNKELFNWINDCVDSKSDYLKLHLIPDSEELWKSKNFMNFIEKRSELIVNKLIEKKN